MFTSFATLTLLLIASIGWIYCWGRQGNDRLLLWWSVISIGEASHSRIETRVRIVLINFLHEFFQYFSSYAVEKFLNTSAIIRVCFSIGHVMKLSHFLPLFFWYYSIIYQIYLISNEDFYCVLIGIQIYLLNPIRDIIETFLTCTIV